MTGSYDRKDHFYKEAKASGLRSRAAFKLQEIDQRYGILRTGMRVLDLGSWPGGWVQVAAERVGRSGLVVGVDLVKVDELPLPQVQLLTGDVRDESTLEAIRGALGGKCDLIVSDMSPKLTGIREADQAGTVACAELAVWVAGQCLRPGGTVVMKVFKGNDTEQFIRGARASFEKITRAELKSTRKTSNEFYVLCLGFKPPT